EINESRNQCKERTSMTRWILRQISFVYLLLSITSCTEKQGEFLKFSVLPRYVIVIVSQDANHAGIAYYNLDGDFLGYVTDFKDIGGTPRGLASVGRNKIVTSVDVADGLYEVDLTGDRSLFYGSALFNGNIYDVEANEDRLYAIETNGIEVFTFDGTRQASSYIATTVGGCTMNTPRGLGFQLDTGYLMVTNQGGTDNILRYNVSGNTATCVSSVAFGNNPWGVVSHPNGYIYVGTQGDDQIYRADPDGSNPTVVFATDTTIINDPTALAVMPNGDILVASSTLDTIERLKPNGTRVGSKPFIQDSFSLNVSDILILETSEE
ncbi:MAG: hypothetical protein KDD25_07415, partial [Bdellovibrionales bacterium]|nr:hypothetical protein [Bdellovibrionales bacterium]